MQSNIYRLSAIARRGISLGVVTCLVLSIFSAGTAEASRLVFTNEGDGVLVDTDYSGDGNFSLFFGEDLSGEIEYDTTLNTFTIQNGDNFAVTGNIDAQGNITNSTGNVTVNDNLDVTGALNVQGGNITLENGETISNSVDGQVDITAATTATSGALNVGTNITVEGTSDLQGNISNSTGDVTINDNLDVTGNIDAQGDISNSTGVVNVNDDFNVTGTTSLDGNTTIETGASFTVTDGTSTFGGALDVNSTSDFGGNITLSADAQIINLRAQNATGGGVPACAAAGDLGVIYYDTGSDQLFYCAETSPSVYGFVSTSNPSAGTTSATFYAEWASFSLYADGTDNIGTVRSEYDDADDRSYYSFTSRRATTQDYDIVLQWRVPDDFTGFDTGTNHLEFDIETGGAGAAVDLRDVQVNGVDQAISDLANTAATWATQQVDLSSATVAAGDTLTFRFTLYADNAPSESRISNVQINYDKQ